MGLETGILALQGASAIGGLAQSYGQSKAIRSQGKYESQVMRQNAEMMRLQAEDAEMRGEDAAQKALADNKRIQARQRASFAANGVVVDRDTAAQVVEDTAVEGALDAQEIRRNALMEAWGYRTQATQTDHNAKFNRMASKNAAKNTLLSGGLGFARDLSGMGYTYSRLYPKKGEA